MIDVQERIPCLYCGGDARLYEKDAHHPYAPGHGPFQLYVCTVCSSILTDPVPDKYVLNALYNSFDSGMHSKVRELRTKYPLHAWFKQCVKHMLKGTSLTTSKKFSWIDVGAGEGEMSNLMLQTFPGHKGTAVDFHDQPQQLAGSDIQWLAADLNDNMPLQLERADLVFAITVFEHMASPLHFIREALDLLKPGGVLYFNCPRADCNAFRLLGKKWPYYLPGEHITVPSISGLEQLMHRECKTKFGERYTLKIAPVIMPYPLGYYLGYYLPFTKKLLTLSANVYIPTGLLECQLILHP